MSSVRHVKGCCPLDCQDTCAWVAKVENERVVEVRGAKEHPFTRGVLCAKVNDYQARTYAPDRLLHPLRRTGPKGAGVFERISWDEALETIADRFSAIVGEHGPEAILPHRFLGSMGVVQRRALMRLFHALGASRVAGSICGASGNLLAEEGMPRGFDPETLTEARLIVIWGANLLSTAHHHWHFINEARRRHGAPVICIDPIRTRTAAKCDEHLAIRPGSDAVLAASVAHVILRDDLADVDFARRAALDLDAFRAQVKPWTPLRASEVCGIPAATIERLAHDLARARPAAIRGGIAPQQTVNGEALVRLLGALTILGGHWRLPGGGLFIEANPTLDEARAERPDLVSGDPRRLDIARLGQHLTHPNLSPPVMALMVWCVNPAVVLPDAGRVRTGLARDDLFTVVLEHFLTDTARYADIVLPSTTQLEHFDVLGAWGHHYVTANNPAIAPLGEAKSHGEVMRLLARRMGLDHPALAESDEAIAASALPDGMDLEDLKAAGWVKTAPPGPAWTGALRLTGGVPLPPARPGPDALHLLTPKAHYFLNSTFVNMPRQRRAQGDPVVEISPADAARLGLTDGERVVVRNAQATIPAMLRVTDSVRTGVAALPGKWWSLPVEDGAVANMLTPAAWSPGGQPAYNDTFVEVASVAAISPEADLDERALEA